MSKYGTIEVNIYDVYTKDQLEAFAKKNKITYEAAESVAKEILYRKAYAKLRNKDEEVKAERKAYNNKRNALRKMLVQA
jgi:hypothetical protein